MRAALAAVALVLVIGSAAFYLWMAYDDRQRMEEDILRADLRNLRKAIEDFHQDRGRHPASLQELVKEGYIRRVPVDPITRTGDSWVEVRDASGMMVDVRGGARGRSHDGAPYAAW
jgi:general secretion pathway protein G